MGLGVRMPRLATPNSQRLRMGNLEQAVVWAWTVGQASFVTMDDLMSATARCPPCSVSGPQTLLRSDPGSLYARAPHGQHTVQHPGCPRGGAPALHRGARVMAHHVHRPPTAPPGGVSTVRDAGNCQSPLAPRRHALPTAAVPTDGTPPTQCLRVLNVELTPSDGLSALWDLVNHCPTLQTGCEPLCPGLHPAWTLRIRTPTELSNIPTDLLYRNELRTPVDAAIAGVTSLLELRTQGICAPIVVHDWAEQGHWNAIIQPIFVWPSRQPKFLPVAPCCRAVAASLHAASGGPNGALAPGRQWLYEHVTSDLGDAPPPLTRIRHLSLSMTGTRTAVDVLTYCCKFCPEITTLELFWKGESSPHIDVSAPLVLPSLHSMQIGPLFEEIGTREREL